MALESNTSRKSQMAERELFWKQSIQEWENSSQSQIDFCRHRGLTRHQFVYWKRKLLQNNDTFKTQSISLAKVPQYLSQTAITSMEGKRAGSLAVISGQYRIEVAESFDTETLNKLLDLIEAR